jgi:hypothetical protein
LFISHLSGLFLITHDHRKNSRHQQCNQIAQAVVKRERRHRSMVGSQAQNIWAKNIRAQKTAGMSPSSLPLAYDMSSSVFWIENRHRTAAEIERSLWRQQHVRERTQDLPQRG